jgi:hypothetical protein
MPGTLADIVRTLHARLSTLTHGSAISRSVSFTIRFGNAIMATAALKICRTAFSDVYRVTTLSRALGWRSEAQASVGHESFEAGAGQGCSNEWENRPEYLMPPSAVEVAGNNEIGRSAKAWK